MRDWCAEIRALKRICERAEEGSEGGVRVAVLPDLAIAVAGAKKPVIRDAVLWPEARDGYPSRLFLSEQIERPGLNWNKTFNMLGRAWQSWSWKDVPNDAPLTEMLTNHLRAFR